MSGLASEPEPSLPGPNSLPAPADSAPWIDTAEMGLEAPQPVASPTATPSGKGPDQLPTIGHIGRYALKYQIGEGGLGRVYAAHDPLLSRLIAIKTLNLEIAAEERESFNALFLNEARAAGGLSHPNIVTVFDAGVSEQGAYIAMELLKGRDLRQLRLEGWKPTPTQAALVVRRVSDALAYAHSKGVVHRDIKPANIFMVGRTQPRVLDFGIARVAHQHESHGDDDVAGGSPYYMSPEQVRHQPVDRRCDVFSLGVVLYELLTGTRPFRGASLKEITDAVVELDPPKAHEVDATVPKALSDIAARAMEKNPEDRYRSARALSRELRHWLEEHAQENADPAEESLTPAKRPIVWALGAVAAVFLAAAVWLVVSSHGSDTDAAQHAAAAAPVASAVAPVVVADPSP
ncbi:MAG TPA: serine/threonine-protein kinase, partial [Rhizobacter sp.]|nr:serine/threonine-protein kinase [Rhizobacter sp.]